MIDDEMRGLQEINQTYTFSEDCEGGMVSQKGVVEAISIFYRGKNLIRHGNALLLLFAD